MSVTMEIVRSFSLLELRRLLTFKENQPQFEALSRRREQLLEEARKLQLEIDELIGTGLARVRRKRLGPTVKELCMEVFKGKKSLRLTAVKVQHAILAKHPHRDNRTFYNQVFIALTRSRLFKKLKTGEFLLDERSVRAEK